MKKAVEPVKIGFDKTGYNAALKLLKDNLQALHRINEGLKGLDNKLSTDILFDLQAKGENLSYEYYQVTHDKLCSTFGAIGASELINTVMKGAEKRILSLIDLASKINLSSLEFITIDEISGIPELVNDHETILKERFTKYLRTEKQMQIRLLQEELAEKLNDLAPLLSTNDSKFANPLNSQPHILPGMAIAYNYDTQRFEIRDLNYEMFAGQ